MLVLIEPGTPTGFANIHEARSSILDYEGRRQLKLQGRLAAASSTAAAAADQAGGQGASSSSSSVLRGDHNLPSKASSKWFGAHVVAPCPHDAPCPLAAPGSKSWCHFGTRFQRPGFMQQAKAPVGSRASAADHQDERYSYVVIR
jgi:ribosomal protein RSM22 (predicted rRNA methylase)